MPAMLRFPTGEDFYALFALAAVVGWLASLGTVTLIRFARNGTEVSSTVWLLIGGPATGIGVLGRRT